MALVLSLRVEVTETRLEYGVLSQPLSPYQEHSPQVLNVGKYGNMEYYKR